MLLIIVTLAAWLMASSAHAQPPVPTPLPPGQTADPFPAPIPATEDVVRVNVREFASLPDIDGVAARAMLLVDEPGTRRLFVNDMRGPLYSVSYDGSAIRTYLDINELSQHGLRTVRRSAARAGDASALHTDHRATGIVRGSGVPGPAYHHADRDGERAECPRVRPEPAFRTGSVLA